MDPFSVTVGVTQILDLCLKYGRALAHMIQAFRRANERVMDLMLRVKTIWFKTEQRIQALRQIWATLPTMLQDHFEDVLERLQAKLQAAVVVLDKYAANSGNAEAITTGIPLLLSARNRTRYSLFEKRLRGTAADLEAWFGIFEPAWYQITLVPSADMDKVLAAPKEQPDSSVSTIQSIRGAIHDAQSEKSTGQRVLRDTDFLDGQFYAVAGSATVLRPTRDRVQTLIVNTTAFPPDTDMDIALASVCELAKLLACCEPETIGLLRCAGVIQTGAQFEILFAIPAELKLPTSLRHLLTLTPPSLDRRFFLAKSLARAVASVHSMRLVHKNIRPDTLMVFASAAQPPVASFNEVDAMYHAAYLVGFEQFRVSSEHTSLVSDLVWHRNIYRHPQRQGINPDARYIMQHDIYSLGVCLLEIGLWSAFVPLDCSDENATPGPVLDIADQLADRNKRQAAFDIKRKLCSMAETLLPTRMGMLYTNVVRSCLTCLDPGEHNLFSGDEDLEDENGVSVGVAYIEKVLMQLDDISIS